MSDEPEQQPCEFCTQPTRPWIQGRYVCYPCFGGLKRQLAKDLGPYAPAHSLLNGGIFTAQDLAQTPDEVLLGMRNIGPVMVTKLRRVVPFAGSWSSVQVEPATVEERMRRLELLMLEVQADLRRLTDFLVRRNGAVQR